MDSSLQSPGYGCLCNIESASKGFIDIVVDSTGLKVYENGE
ncbi:hypothetical protein PCIT_b0755 [Pseudoalteromonas citrea]|uniref:Uncharacterized protein n=2 Tax=Pseudoalteromonas citrea TaxID=43655 RepID=A0AAD4AEW9_9GAMM|nr:hypothetical protein PCIT_b0755 [Pseudoalteromonas citrea]